MKDRSEYWKHKYQQRKARMLADDELRLRMNRWSNEWKKRNPEKVKESANRRDRKYREIMDDRYVKTQLKNTNKILIAYPEIIELKRQSLKFHRLLKQKQSS